MKKYIFYDTDPSGREEYDIHGKDYEKLIRTCCKYSKTFSVVVTQPEASIVKELQVFQIPRAENIPYIYTHYGDNSVYVRFYRVCPDLCELLIHVTNGMFEWIDGWGFTNPSDPTFYREDGSVFFTSTIHNGICILAPKPDEYVNDIVQNTLWNSKNMEPDQWEDR